MDAQVYREAVEERRVLLESLDSLEAQAAMIQAQIKANRSKVRALDALLEEFAKLGSQHNLLDTSALSAKARAPSELTLDRKAKRLALDAMINKAEALILDAGRPLSRTELLLQLQEHGFEIDGADKSKVLGTNLWRSKRFHNLKGVGYWPVSHPAPLGYADCETRPSMLLGG